MPLRTLLSDGLAGSGVAEGSWELLLYLNPCVFGLMAVAVWLPSKPILNCYIGNTIHSGFRV